MNKVIDGEMGSDGFSFSSQNKDLAEVEIAKYPEGRKASAVMPLLELAQRQNGGWLSRAAMDYVAETLDMPFIKVYEVATFYTMYNLKKVGKFHVQVCTNLPCWLRGSDQVVDACKNQLNISFGETSEDAMFTLTEVECLGACVNAPMMQVNDDYYEDLNEVSTKSILSELASGNSPKPGSQIDRKSCEPIGGLTSLIQQSKEAIESK